MKEGYSLIIGGDRDAFDRLAPEADKGYAHVGPSGSGHFVKMVHNGIEYGMMQAYAEGFELMAAKEEFELDLAKIAELWRYGSVVRSWLLDLIATALEEDGNPDSLAAYVDDSDEGRWTVEESIELAVLLPKTGLRAEGAAANAGELYLADIGVPPELYAEPKLALSVGPIFGKNDLIRLS